VEGLPGSRPTPGPPECHSACAGVLGHGLDLIVVGQRCAPTAPVVNNIGAVVPDWATMAGCAGQVRAPLPCTPGAPRETGVPRTSSRTPRWALRTRSSWSARTSRGLRHREQPHHHAVSRAGARRISHPRRGQ